MEDIVEIKAFVPAKDFEQSKAFYRDIGFTQASDGGGVAYFRHGNSSFLLQDFYCQQHAENFMMHVLVKDIHAWRTKVVASGVVEKYKVRLSEVVEQPWGMLDFTLTDPSGVLWRFGENI
ncbi:glyoxalase [Hahella sp. KA22]|uniref:VOC family protein n=1 Tax=Hahella sp. KA22 TaxID=1628392 RepID=UPI000FDD1CCF|nr:VOC family protein [Hahella sp. KA22]AZZ92117.1 glyoxalase [Hahella sp. KA22]QAY55488.1 glyoxalase [Hahella sp. KA22]